MKLAKSDSFFPSTTFGKVFDDFFNTNLGEFFGDEMKFTMPSVNVVENPESFDLEIAAPGLSKEDFNINVEHNMLTISAEKSSKEEETKEENNYVRREFNYSMFKRSFQLPDTVDADKIEAGYDNGVLRLYLPKREEAKAKPTKTIEIK